MSTPKPPALACIAEAIEAQFRASGMIRPRLAAQVAQAVWDALLAEGRIEDYDDYHALVLPFAERDPEDS